MANITEDEVKNEWVKRLKIKQAEDKAVKDALRANKAAGLLKIKNDKVAENPTSSPYSENWGYKGDDIEQQWKDTGGWGFGVEDNGQGFFTPLPLVQGQTDNEIASTPQSHPRYPNSPFYNTPNELKGVSPWIIDEFIKEKGKAIFKLNTGIPLAHQDGGGFEHWAPEVKTDFLKKHDEEFQQWLKENNFYIDENEEEPGVRKKKNKLGSSLKIRTA